MRNNGRADRDHQSAYVCGVLQSGCKRLARYKALAGAVKKACQDEYKEVRDMAEWVLENLKHQGGL